MQAPQQADQWDESTRGQKMSSAHGKVIFKYQMPVLERFTMRLPRGAEIIRTADQGGMFWLWAVVDTRVPDEDRHFVAVKCGANAPAGNLRYTKTKAKPAPSTPTSKRAKVKAARKQRPRHV